MVNLRKILAIKFFRISHQIHKGFASIFVKPFSSRLLQIFTMLNCRFKVQIRMGLHRGAALPSTLKTEVEPLIFTK